MRSQHAAARAMVGGRKPRRGREAEYEFKPVFSVVLPTSIQEDFEGWLQSRGLLLQPYSPAEADSLTEHYLVVWEDPVTARSSHRPRTVARHTRATRLGRASLSRHLARASKGAQSRAFIHFPGPNASRKGGIPEPIREGGPLPREAPRTGLR